jgi:hypothetical protein
MGGSLFPGFDEYMDGRKATAQKAYEEKLLKKLYAVVSSMEQFETDKREAGEDFGFNWFNDCGYSNILMFSKKDIVVNPAHVLSTAGFTKTALWVSYFDIKNRLPKGTPVAMFFSIVHMSHFVIHNVSFLEITPNQNVVVRQGKSLDAQLRVEPMTAFLAALSHRAGK